DKQTQTARRALKPSIDSRLTKTVGPAARHRENGRLRRPHGGKATMPSTSESNKELVKRYTKHGFAEVLKGNVDAVHEYLHDHYVRHTGTQHDRGATTLDSVKEGLANAASAFSDARHRVDHVVADGDFV